MNMPLTHPTPLAAFARRISPAPLLPRRIELSRWQPGQGRVFHSEVFAAGSEGSGAALVLALALDHCLQSAAEGAVGEENRSWLWVQDAAAISLGGRPYRPGLPAVLRHRLVHVCAKTPEDALFALEEGLRCRDLAFVMGEIAGNPRALDFTASRRLSLTAERHGVPLWLVRLDAQHDLSSARMRWDAAGAPSHPSRWNPAAPGDPAWRGKLFRARGHPPGEWILSDNGRGTGSGQYFDSDCLDGKRFASR